MDYELIEEETDVINEETVNAIEETVNAIEETEKKTREEKDEKQKTFQKRMSKEVFKNMKNKIAEEETNKENENVIEEIVQEETVNAFSSEGTEVEIHVERGTRGNRGNRGKRSKKKKVTRYIPKNKKKSLAPYLITFATGIFLAAPKIMKDVTLAEKVVLIASLLFAGAGICFALLDLQWSGSKKYSSVSAILILLGFITLVIGAMI